MDREDTSEPMVGAGNQPTVAIATLGCKLNQAESEEISRRFSSAGYCVVGFEQAADIYVINTCSVTHIADRKSRQLIRQARRASPECLLVVTGCFAEVSPQEVSATDKVDMVINNQDKARLVEMIDETRMRSQPASFAGIGIQSPSALSRTRAMLKIQEGCNKFCAYCIVPLARGRERSKPIDEVITDIRQLVDDGRKEVVLTGVNIGVYGQDLPNPAESTLFHLVERILNETALPRLRLSSVEPEDFDERLFSLMNGRLARHLHLPLQSGSDQVLRLMRRRYSSDWFLGLVERARKAVPNVAITTDIIVGFPGEGEMEFLQTMDLARRAKFAGIHVFKYSARRGTRASQLPNQVPYLTKQQRSADLLSLANRSGRDYRRTFIDQTIDVLYEERVPDGDSSSSTALPVWEGLTDTYIRVFSTSELPLGNEIKLTRITAEHKGGLWGSIEAIQG